MQWHFFLASLYCALFNFREGFSVWMCSLRLRGNPGWNPQSKADRTHGSVRSDCTLTWAVLLWRFLAWPSLCWCLSITGTLWCWSVCSCSLSLVAQWKINSHFESWCSLHQSSTVTLVILFLTLSGNPQRVPWCLSFRKPASWFSKKMTAFVSH